MGGTVYMGYEDGRSEAWNEYGHRPWQKGFEDRRRSDREGKALRKFQAEFAALYGPEQRGWSEQFGKKAARSYSDEYHNHLLTEAARFGIRPRKAKEPAA